MWKTTKTMKIESRENYSEHGLQADYNQDTNLDMIEPIEADGPRLALDDGKN